MGKKPRGGGVNQGTGRENCPPKVGRAKSTGLTAGGKRKKGGDKKKKGIKDNAGRQDKKQSIKGLGNPRGKKKRQDTGKQGPAKPWPGRPMEGGPTDVSRENPQSRPKKRSGKKHKRRTNRAEAMWGPGGGAPEPRFWGPAVGQTQRQEQGGQAGFAQEKRRASLGSKKPKKKNTTAKKWSSRHRPGGKQGQKERQADPRRTGGGCKGYSCGKLMKRTLPKPDCTEGW